jgi:flagellar biosynthetic protein FliP
MMLCFLLVIASTSAKASSWPVSPVASAEFMMQPAQAMQTPLGDLPAQPVAAPSINVPALPAATPLANNTPTQASTVPPASASPQVTTIPLANSPIQLGTMPTDPNELRVTGLGGGSAQWTIVILLTFLTLIPSVLICMTPFARLLIVFHFLRQALGLQTTPSNQTLIGLSVIMTFFLMQPVGVAIYNDSVVPLQAGKITALDAVTRAAGPMRQFMSHYVREKDVALFLEMAKEPRPANINDVSFRVLLPAYILSELKAGFQIGAVLFLPFLVVDMVVASITTSVGMMQLPPVVISTPLKLLLFLMVDGWHLLIGALMRSFN